MKIAICESDMRTCEYMKRQLQQELSTRYKTFYIGSYSDGFSMLDGATHDDNFDLYFINASMSGLNGVELARELKRYRDNSLLVLYSVSDKYAMAAWSIKAFYYLMLPPLKKDISRIITRAEQYLKERDNRFLRVKLKDGWYHILLRNIFYIESNAHKIIINMVDGGSLTTYGKLDNCEAAINDEQFIRIHKSILLNGIYISKISASEVVCYNGSVFPISRALQEMTRQKYEAFVKSNSFITI